MKISLNWIKEFTDVKCSVDELVAKIGAQLGEVEEVINLGERYAGIVTAKVVRCEDHPNADKLTICKIDDDKKVKNVARDEDGLVQVVCGAPNVRSGITVAWIPPGSVVPSTFDGEKFTLEARELRGVTSNGMLASGKELEINDNHEGILILDKPAELGTPIAEVYKLDDYIIDVENKMFTHRPDCFGQLGVAREIAGIQGIKFTSPEWYEEALDAFKISSDTKLELRVDNKLPELVPRFSAIVMSDVHVMKSPVMIQSFLYRVGVKPINNIVDITNFVMMLTAQPMHAYDYDKLRALDNSNSAHIVVRKPKKGEKLLLLDGKTIEPHEDAITIASKDKLIGLGGVMGGAESEVDDNTQNIVLECANFDMYSIRRSSMRHGIFSEAVTRFNKGQSPWQNDKVMAYAVAWVQKLANGKVASKLSDETKPKNHNKSVSITKEFINDRLGSELTTKDITGILKNVEFKVESKDGELSVTAPYWRTDIEIPEDLVEEVGRLHGYDKLPIELPKRTLEPAGNNQLIDTKWAIREVLSAAGANEVLTYSFVHGKLFEQVGQDEKLAYQLSNALSPELQYYRLSLLPSLLDKVHGNIKAGYGEFAVFELNKTHDKSNIHEDSLPIEEERLALAFTADAKSAKRYSGSPYYQARKYVEYLAQKLGLVNVVFEPIKHSPKTDTGKQLLQPFAKQRAASIKTSNGILLGVVGEITQQVKKAMKLPEFTAGLEMDVQMLEQYIGNTSYKPLSRFPSTTQDISFKADLNLLLSDLEGTITEVLEQAKIDHHYDHQLSTHDVYQPENAKKKHVAFRISLSHPEKTLVTEEVNALLARISEVVAKKHQASRIE